MPNPESALPSIDRLLRSGPLAQPIARHGRRLVTDLAREHLAALRRELRATGAAATDDQSIAAAIAARAAALTRPAPGPVFNLTGTVLHTNLGRSPLPPEAVAAMAAAAGTVDLEYDLGAGKRGDRDGPVAALLCRLTGAEAATVVNNNAAAVLLALNTLANRREVPVSRGELVEIGDSFRLPDILRRAGARLVEVGTTNRTHGRDYAEAIGPRTAALMTVHQSNFAIEGFTARPAESEIAALAHRAGLPYLVDLGSGALIDLAAFGLPPEPTPAETLGEGADLVTFSGDKLLGGPQAGLIVGRADLVGRIRRNPLRRALRLDKVMLAALGAVLRLYLDPDRVIARVPALALLARPGTEILALAEALAPAVANAVRGRAEVGVRPCQSQIGSGARPQDLIPSHGLAIVPLGPRRGRNKALARLAATFRALPVPVIGRVADGALIFDLRGLQDADAFRAQLPKLDPGPAP